MKRGVSIRTVVVALAVFLAVLHAATRIEADADAPPDPLAEAVARGSRRDYEGARGALAAVGASDRATARALYFAARVESSDGNFARATDLYARAIAAGLPGDVADRASLAHALLQARTGRCAQALPFFHARGERRDERGALARAAEAECTLETGSASDAVARLSSVVAESAGPVDGVAARLALADALVRTGERARAVAMLRELYLARPTHRDVATIEARLRSLDPSALELTRDERLARVQKLADAGANTDALAALDSLGRPEGRAALAAFLHLRGTLLLSLRTRPRDAAHDFAEAARLGGATAIEDEFMAARSLARADRDDEAIAAYDRFVRSHPRDARAEEATFLAALIAIRGGRPGAERRLQRFAKQSPAPTASRRADAERLLAIDALDRRKPAEAVAHLARFRALESDSADEVDYWTARAKHALGERAAARALDRALVARSPLGYYGLLATQRLREAGERVELPVRSRVVTARPTPALPDDVAFLASLSFIEEASDSLLRTREASIRAAAPRGSEREHLIAAYVSIGDSARAYELARGLGLDVTRSDASGWLVDALYPRPYADDVRRAVSTFADVSPAYVYGTMRQESAYAPSAVSRVGAIGLLQLMPSTGARVAARFGASFDREILFDPAWNVRLGVAEMAMLVERLPALVLVAAAYNGGEGRVVRWLGASGTVELDRFVERIPFEETRRYVKRVLSHQAVYNVLDGKPDEALGAVPLRISWNH